MDAQAWAEVFGSWDEIFRNWQQDGYHPDGKDESTRVHFITALALVHSDEIVTALDALHWRPGDSGEADYQQFTTEIAVALRSFIGLCVAGKVTPAALAAALQAPAARGGYSGHETCDSCGISLEDPMVIPVRRGSGDIYCSEPCASRPGPG